MINYLLLLGISYSIIVAFLVWVVFYKGFKTKGKILIVFFLPCLYFLHWAALQESRGWPTDKTLPIQFELLSADIVEPHQLKKVKGNIHLWIRPKENGKPRSYILPYTRELHKKLFETKQRIAHGRGQIGLLYDSESRERGVDVGGGMKLGFINAPRKRLPPKN